MPFVVMFRDTLAWLEIIRLSQASLRIGYLENASTVQKDTFHSPAYFTYNIK
jgi:hypothetical protein